MELPKEKRVHFCNLYFVRRNLCFVFHLNLYKINVLSRLCFISTCLSGCYYHVTYESQCESTLCSYLNVKECLAQNRRDIWSLSDSNGIGTQNHLVCKRTLNHLANSTIWLNSWVFVYKLSGFRFVIFKKSMFSLFLKSSKAFSLSLNTVIFLSRKEKEIKSIIRFSP